MVVKHEKLLDKLMYNTVYGKTTENVKNRIDARLVTNEKDYLKWASNTGYLSQKIFDSDFVLMQTTKVKLTNQL